MKKVLSVVIVFVICTIIITLLCIKPYVPSKQLTFKSHVEKIVDMRYNIDSVSLVYKDIPIDNIWKINLRASNTGKNTIFGTGSSSDIDSNGVIINIGSNYEVLNCRINTNDCKGRIQIINNHINVRFRRWNIQEVLCLDVFVCGSNNIQDVPVIKINERDLVGIRIKNVSQIIENKAQFDWFYEVKKVVPSWIIAIGKWFALFFCVCFCLGSVLAPIVAMCNEVGYMIWKAIHYEDYCQTVNESDLDNGKKKELIENPSEMSQDISQLLDFPIPPEHIPWFILLFGSTVGLILCFLPFLLCGLFLYYNL